MSLIVIDFLFSYASFNFIISTDFSSADSGWEQDTMMNIPENLQECERYYNMEAYVEFMEEAIEHLDDVIDIFDEMM